MFDRIEPQTCAILWDTKIQNNTKHKILYRTHRYEDMIANLYEFISEAVNFTCSKTIKNLVRKITVFFANLQFTKMKTVFFHSSVHFDDELTSFLSDESSILINLSTSLLVTN